MSIETIKKVCGEVEIERDKYLKQEQFRNIEEWEDDKIQLKDDSEIKQIIADFGYGETNFHTADIWRILKELMHWQTKYRLLRVKELDAQDKIGEKK